MGTIMYGKCGICGKETSVQRTYYVYNVPCECHHGRHSEHVNHCKDCKPREPKETRITMDTKKLKETIFIDAGDLEHLLNCMCHQKYINSSGQLSERKVNDQKVIDKAYHAARELLTSVPE